MPKECPPLVSFVMATYNNPVSHLIESISSILNQTYSNIELIIADDSTIIEAKEIIDDYAQKDNRILIVRENVRMGFTHALNKAILMARGDFIARMDADDICARERIEKQLPFFESDDIGIVGGFVRSFSDNNPQSEVIKFPVSPKDVQKIYKYGGNIIAHPASIIRKRILERVGFYDENYKCSEDFDLWSKALLICNIMNVPQVVLNYRIHDNNAHIVQQGLQAQLCCVSQIKYAFGIDRCLKKEEFDFFNKLVETKWICRFNSYLRRNTGIYARILRRLHLYQLVPLTMITIYSWPIVKERYLRKMKEADDKF